MTIYEGITIVVSLFALFVSVRTVILNSKQIEINSKQIEKAAEALKLQQQISRGDAVMHFTTRFLELVKNGEPCHQFNICDDNWIYEYWSLHATEFYFFHHGILPKFMYSLWMIDLGKLYAGINGSQVRSSHTEYLNTYSLNYPEMIEFFHVIYTIAEDNDDVNSRNRKISESVSNWIRDYRKNEIG